MYKKSQPLLITVVHLCLEATSQKLNVRERTYSSAMIAVDSKVVFRRRSKNEVAQRLVMFNFKLFSSNTVVVVSRLVLSH
jgi:hypothetical protein